MQWHVVIAHFLIWLWTFLCVWKGADSAGKVVYVTATMPYVLITILLAYGLTLPGAIDGVKFFLVPDWSRLLHISVWTEAVIQVFYQLGPAWGGLITLASYNEFHQKSYRFVDQLSNKIMVNLVLFL